MSDCVSKMGYKKAYTEYTTTKPIQNIRRGGGHKGENTLSVGLTNKRPERAGVPLILAKTQQKKGNGYLK